MWFKYSYILIAPALFVGCSSSRNEAVHQPLHDQERAAVQESTAVLDADAALPPTPEALKNARTWTPQFIPTGFASGIMVEFTGLKQNAKLNARFAGIELQRSVQDTSLPATLTLTTTINDLRQAFFKVRPGVYLLRQTKAWAEQSYIRAVEVREGNYSVITIGVLNPRTAKVQSASDTNDTK
jgi:hypothetical protein